MAIERFRNLSLEEIDRQTVFHPSTHLRNHAHGVGGGPRIIDGGQGIRITDRNGVTAIDAFAGLYCVNIGYGRQEVAEAIADQARELAYFHAYAGHGTEAAITLAQMVMDRAPDHMARVYFGLGGSDANETNVKLVWYMNNILGRPEKKKIIARWRGYHGSGLMSGSLTGLSLFHRKFDLPLDTVRHTTAPYYYRRDDVSQTEEQFSAQCAADLEALIEAEGADTIAAFIAEPMLGTGGIVPPPKGYWEAIRDAVRPGDVVVDIGTGTGLLAMMAARAGAGRCYAVELSAASAELARRCIAANGLTDRIDVVVEDAMRFDPPEPVDVVVSELIGNFGFDERMQELLKRAAASWLKPGGRLVPRDLSSLLVPVECRDGPSSGWGRHPGGIDLSTGLDIPLDGSLRVQHVHVPPPALAPPVVLEHAVMGDPAVARADRLTSVGIVAYGRDHAAEVDVAEVGFY